MSTLSADTRVVTCYGACNRTRQVYTRLLGSRPVYSCGGCGATREIHELGGPGMEGSLLKPLTKEDMAGEDAHHERIKRYLAEPEEKDAMKMVESRTAKAAIISRIIRKSADQVIAAAALRLRAARDTRHAQEKKPMPKEPTAPPMRALIFDIVGQALAEQPKPLTAEEVREIVQTELNRAFGIETKTAGGAQAKITAETCVRMPHKGQHGRACREALEAAK